MNKKCDPIVLRDFPEALQALIPPKTLGLLIKQRIRIKDDDKWDLSAWKKLLVECRRCVCANITCTADILRFSLEDLLHSFPTSVQHWRELINFEINQGRIEKTKELFRRVLSMPLFYVPLWQDYVSFIRNIHQVKGTDNNPELKKAFEFTLDKMGQDLNSGPLWIEYLNMLLSINTANSESKSIFEENNPIDYIRSNLRRCLAVPHSSLDEALKLSDQFETQIANHRNSSEKISLTDRALKSVQRARDQATIYKKSKEYYKSRRNIYASVNLELMATPSIQNTTETQIQNNLWQNIVEYERSNPQHLPLSELMKRVHFAFEQALIPFYRYSSFWLKYAQHISCPASGLSFTKGALQVLERAKEACPYNVALSLMQIQLLEQAGEKKSAKDVYESLCTEMESGDENFGPEQGSLIWIHYMHFLRRLEMPIKSRELFLRAKNWNGCTWQVYMASALMEWRSNEMGDVTLKVVRKIFEKGTEKFSDDPGYINAYCSWLIGIGDENGARHLYERVLKKPNTKKNNRSLWELYLDFEASRGDLGASQAIERRMIDALSQSDYNIDIGTLRMTSFLRRSRLYGIAPYHAFEFKDMSKYIK